MLALPPESVVMLVLPAGVCTVTVSPAMGELPFVSEISMRDDCCTCWGAVRICSGGAMTGVGDICAFTSVNSDEERYSRSVTLSKPGASKTMSYRSEERRVGKEC